MKGQILDYSVQDNKGIITVEDGKRYHFEGKEWKESILPTRGLTVDFDVDEANHAIDIYKALKGNGINLSSLAHTSGISYTKSKVVAGLLAFFLGGFGAHKFYLGMPIPGIIYILISFLSWIIAIITDQPAFILFGLVVGLFSLIDTIIYLTRSDEDFQRIYVEDKRQWF